MAGLLQKELREFQPSLINLKSYGKELKWCLKENKFLRLFPSIPPCPYSGGWNKKELSAMRKNRASAKLLYQKALREGGYV